MLHVLIFFSALYIVAGNPVSEYNMKRVLQLYYVHLGICSRSIMVNVYKSFICVLVSHCTKFVFKRYVFVIYLNKNSDEKINAIA